MGGAPRRRACAAPPALAPPGCRRRRAGARPAHRASRVRARCPAVQRARLLRPAALALRARARRLLRRGPPVRSPLPRVHARCGVARGLRRLPLRRPLRGLPQARRGRGLAARVGGLAGDAADRARGPAARRVRACRGPAPAHGRAACARPPHGPRAGAGRRAHPRCARRVHVTGGGQERVPPVAAVGPLQPARQPGRRRVRLEHELRRDHLPQEDHDRLPRQRAGDPALLARYDARHVRGPGVDRGRSRAGGRDLRRRPRRAGGRSIASQCGPAQRALDRAARDDGGPARRSPRGGRHAGRLRPRRRRERHLRGRRGGGRGGSARP